MLGSRTKLQNKKLEQYSSDCKWILGELAEQYHPRSYVEQNSGVHEWKEKEEKNRNTENSNNAEEQFFNRKIDDLQQKKT